MIAVSGRVAADPAGAGSFTGHRILLTWTSPPEPDSGVAAPGASPVAAHDTFARQVPDGMPGAEAAVLAPSGVVLSRTTLSATRLTKPVNLKARPAPRHVVRPLDDPRLGADSEPQDLYTDADQTTDVSTRAGNGVLKPRPISACSSQGAA